jgi:hypothetical protein
MLTLIAPIAVLTWWVYLDKRVAHQVEEKVEERTQQLSGVLEHKLTENFNALFQKRQKEFEKEQLALFAELDKAQKHIEAVEHQLGAKTQTLLLGFMMLHAPWELEKWVEETQLIDSKLAVEMATRLALKYLGIVQGFQKDFSKQEQTLKDEGAPQTTPIWYWDAANMLQRRLRTQHSAPPLIDVEISTLQPYMTIYSNQHP